MKFQAIRLLQGCHPEIQYTGHGCVMNVCSYLAGDHVITDRPSCVHPVIRDVMMWMNDSMEDKTRQTLIPFIMRAMKSQECSTGHLKDSFRCMLHEAVYYQHYARPQIQFVCHSSEYDILKSLMTSMPSSLLYDPLLKWLDRVLPPLEDANVDLVTQQRVSRLNEMAEIPRRHDVMYSCLASDGLMAYHGEMDYDFISNIVQDAAKQIKHMTEISAFAYANDTYANAYCGIPPKLKPKLQPAKFAPAYITPDFSY